MFWFLMVSVAIWVVCIMVMVVRIIRLNAIHEKMIKEKVELDYAYEARKENVKKLVNEISKLTNDVNMDGH